MCAEVTESPMATSVTRRAHGTASRSRCPTRSLPASFAAACSVWLSSGPRRGRAAGRRWARAAAGRWGPDDVVRQPLAGLQARHEGPGGRSEIDRAPVLRGEAARGGPGRGGPGGGRGGRERRAARRRVDHGHQNGDSRGGDGREQGEAGVTPAGGTWHWVSWGEGRSPPCPVTAVDETENPEK